jgi:uncharacterized protein (TIGR02147 family)
LNALKTKKNQRPARSEIHSLMRHMAQEIDVRNFADLASWVMALHKAMKSKVKPWSFLDLSEACGLGHTNWLAQVVTHRRRLTESSALKLAQALHLNAGQTEVVRNLARHALARDPMRRQKVWSHLEASQSKRNNSLEEDKRFQFLDEWHHVVVLETITLFPEGATAEEVADTIRYSLNVEAVERSLGILSELGFVRKRNGFDEGIQAKVPDRWEKCLDDLDLGSSIPGNGVLRYHHRMIDLGKDALTHLPEQEREISAITLSCPKEELPKLKRVLEEFQRYLLWLAAQNKSADTVFQLNMQLFPLTKDRRLE